MSGYTSHIPMISPGCPIKSTYVLLISPLHYCPVARHVDGSLPQRWDRRSPPCPGRKAWYPRLGAAGSGWERLGKCWRKSMKIIVSSIFPSTMGHTAIQISLNSWTGWFLLALEASWWHSAGITRAAAAAAASADDSTTRKNLVIYNVFVPLAFKQNREHTAYLRFAKTVGLTILGGFAKSTHTKITTTTTTGPSSNSYNNNDDGEDDDHNDNDDNDDSYLVQMKSPSLIPSPDPYRHRRCAKLYNIG